MKLNDVITIYSKNGQSYSRKVLRGVYWWGSQGYIASGNGTSIDYQYQVHVPRINEVFHLGDIVVYGEQGDITSKAELPADNIFTINHIEINKANSKLDHILISGK